MIYKQRKVNILLPVARVQNGVSALKNANRGRNDDRGQMSVRCPILFAQFNRLLLHHPPGNQTSSVDLSKALLLLSANQNVYLLH